MAWPLLWTIVFALDLPLARSIPSSQWHAHEMIYGTYGAALVGFLTSAAAEWTDTPPRQGRDLLLLLGLWLPGRIVGVLGADTLVWFAAATDLGFLGLLGWFVARPMIDRRSTRHASFVLWIVLLGAVEIAIRATWIMGALDLSARLLQTALLIFVVLFASALGRINVAVLNLALDPSGKTTPYRPHPGRQNLAAAMTALYALASLLFPESQAPAFLALAAGCTFMDKLAEWFIGRSVWKGHVLSLGLANLLAGLGLIAIGVAGLGAPISRVTGLHILGLGGLGLAVISVFIIAGLRHTGRPLVLPWQAHAALLLTLTACLIRVMPEMGVLTGLAGRHYALAAILWTGAFGVWLIRFLPFLLEPAASSDTACRDGLLTPTTVIPLARGCRALPAADSARNRRSR
jgi:uncharacterized protein involved in response to NO